MAEMNFFRPDVVIEGDCVLPSEWVVFAPLEAAAGVPPGAFPPGVPDVIESAGRVFSPQRVRPCRCQYDLAEFFGPDHAAETFGKAALIYIVFNAQAAGAATFGFGADHRFTAWLNGEQVAETSDSRYPPWPPAITDTQVTVHLRSGRNVLTVYFIGGKGSSLLAIGGPLDLRRGDIRSIRTDPAIRDPRWRDVALRTAPRGKEVVALGSRRELFVDDFLIDDHTAAARLRLHQPQRREVVMKFDREWERPLCRYFTLLQDGERVLLYYTSKPSTEVAQQEGLEQRCMKCLAESRDGIHFERVVAGRHPFNGSTDNNIIQRGRSGHNLTPFIDTRPDCAPDQRYKAIGDYHEGIALGAYVSPDGMDWRLAFERPILTKGGFDSQNLAFWDPNLGCYVCYYRDNTGGLRRVFRSRSDDFINWSQGEELLYDDDRLEHLYTNCIRPHPTAPHLYIGTPLRFVTHRTKVIDDHGGGISDGVFMSSRDGLHFHRWEQSFIAPDANPANWTQRKNEPAMGTVLTAPDELSLYWREMDGADGLIQLRRGVVRPDGFVSLHSPIETVGEVLTRPLLFSGSRLHLNYTTSAVGTLRIGICDQQGRSIKDFSLDDSEILFGNELDHPCRWLGGDDLGRLAGQPVRLRIRLHDADFFSLRFC